MFYGCHKNTWWWWSWWYLPLWRVKGSVTAAMLSARLSKLSSYLQQISMKITSITRAAYTILSSHMQLQIYSQHSVSQKRCAAFVLCVTSLASHVESYNSHGKIKISWKCIDTAVRHFYMSSTISMTDMWNIRIFGHVTYCLDILFPRLQWNMLVMESHQSKHEKPVSILPHFLVTSGV